MDGAPEVRRAASGDREALRALDERTASTPIEKLWVAHRGARLVGFAALGDHFFGRAFVEVLVVAPDARRGGVGTALLGKRGWIASGRIDNLDDGDPELVFVKRL